MKRKKYCERRVEEVTNLWCTWMGEILINFGENGQHLPSNTPPASTNLPRAMLVPASLLSRH